jgi:hypothetical protein
VPATTKTKSLKLVPFMVVGIDENVTEEVELESVLVPRAM